MEFVYSNIGEKKDLDTLVYKYDKEAESWPRISSSFMTIMKGVVRCGGAVSYDFKASRRKI